jgi:hypothetical protein
MKKVFGVILAIVLALSIVTPASANGSGDPYVTDLIAGQHYDVGDVEVWNDGEYLHVTYVVDGGWTLMETHLSVQLDWKDIPQTKKKNPIPGQFEYAQVGTGEYVIPLDEIGAGAGTELYIAAHGVVQEGTGATSVTLPEEVCFEVSLAYNGAPSYFPAVTVYGGTSLDGTYTGWCIDTDLFMPRLTPLCNAVVYSELPAGLIEYPENFDLVTWILNQDYVGKASTCNGTYTYGDIQRAIWALIDNVNSVTPILRAWDQCRVDEILAAAEANGEGYVPGCGENMWVILAAPGAQPIIIPLPIECGGEEETAWAAGYDFPGKNWAMYFTYTVD